MTIEKAAVSPPVIRVDYHFHPNLWRFSGKRGNSKSAGKKAQRIWKKFDEEKLDVVICAEHAFKDPGKAYACMMDAKGESPTYLVPGVEALTKDGIDVIVFSSDPDYLYGIREIITPFETSLPDLLSFVKKDPNLYSIIPHPLSLARGTITRKYSHAMLRKCIREAGFVEKHNMSFLAFESAMDRFPRVRSALKTRIKKGKKTLETIAMTRKAPHNRIGKGVIFTTGSDAHHVGDIGPHAEIQCNALPINDEQKFALIVSHRTHRKPVIPKKMYKKKSSIFRSLIANGIIVLCEGGHKNVLRGKKIIREILVKTSKKIIHKKKAPGK